MIVIFSLSLTSDKAAEEIQDRSPVLHLCLFLLSKPITSSEQIQISFLASWLSTATMQIENKRKILSIFFGE